MANLTRTNWPLGWTPGSDAVNGDPNGLLRSDNLRMDKLGVTSLIDGHRKLSGGTNFATKFHSKIVDGVEYLWIAYGLPVNTIDRTTNFTSSTSLFIPGAGTPGGHACFGDAFGFVLGIAGTFRVKDRITNTVKPLGLLTPMLVSGKGPAGVVNGPATKVIAAPSLVVIGTGTAPTVKVDRDTFEGAVVSGTTLDIDTIAIGTGRPDRDFGDDIVEFPFTTTDGSPESIVRVVVDFILDGSPNNPTTYANYFEMTFEAGDIQSGEGTKTILSQKRSQAVRFGNDGTKNWSSVLGIRCLVVAADNTIAVTFGAVTFKGGTGGLNGVYQYIQQDVSDLNGLYQAKSPVSALAVNTADATTSFNVNSGSVTLTPIRRDPNTGEFRFYRQSVSDLGIDPNTGLPLNESSLNTFYYVGSLAAGTIGATFTDTLSDTEVLQLNADGSFMPNLFLKTLNTNDVQNGLQDTIFAIEGLYKDRMLYMGASFLYMSDRLNPDAIDTRYIYKPSGDTTEKNLWIKKLTNDTLVLGTTKDLYEISGSLAELPDGTMDIAIRPIGEANPPLSLDVCKYGNGLFYVAADGLRVTAGSNSENVSPQLREFFKAFTFVPAPSAKSVHGIPIAGVYSGVGVNYSIAAAHQKIYIQIPCRDQTRRLIVFDTVTKSYSLMFADPITLHATQAGELIAAFQHGYGGAAAVATIWMLDTLPGLGYDGGTGIPFRLRTVFDANGQPRNRKDTFTLKLVLDTGGRNVSVDIQKDGAGVTENDETLWKNLGVVSATGQQTVYLRLDSTDITLGFRYALQITDVSGSFTFKLYEATIEYEPRPEQLNYLRLLPTNLGTISRKRWTAFAFVIDTLGNNITFTPYLDNTAWTSSGTISNGTKLTYIFYFDSEAIATDMGGLLIGSSSAVFEFYGLNLEECVSEKLPPPVTYLVIPGNNYGSPNRKRHTSYKFQINTRGSRVRFTPRLDNVSHTPTTYTTSSKTTVDYYFPQSDGDVIGIDIGGILESVETPKVPFEFYGVVAPQTVETLPDRLEFLRIPNANFGIADRKRIRTISLVLDTRGQPVVYTPYVDNQPHSATTTFTTTGKSTVWFYFHSDTVGVDFGGVLSTDTGTPFEFYGIGTPDNVEPLPLPVTYYIIPPNNYGTPNRKRHTSYKWQMITRGSRVKFTPRLDQVEYTPEYYSTTVKQLCEYFFPERAPTRFDDYPGGGDVIGIDVGGVLESVESPPVPFEFYEVVIPQKVEALPDRLQYLRIPNTNFGVAARKRIRTIPIVIDTYGHRVRYTPIVDDRLYPHTIFQTYSKTTVHHFFEQDVFGTDFGGILSCEE